MTTTYKLHKVPGLADVAVARHGRQWNVIDTASENFLPDWPFQTYIGQTCDDKTSAIAHAYQLAEERGIK